jgi:hypothetical protein
MQGCTSRKPRCERLATAYLANWWPIDKLVILAVDGNRARAGVYLAARVCGPAETVRVPGRCVECELTDASLRTLANCESQSQILQAQHRFNARPPHLTPVKCSGLPIKVNSG